MTGCLGLARYRVFVTASCTTQLYQPRIRFVRRRKKYLLKTRYHATRAWAILTQYPRILCSFLRLLLMQLMLAAGVAKPGAFQLLAVEALEIAIGVVVVILALRAL